MYKIQTPNITLLKNYLAEYGSAISQIMNEWAAGKVCTKISIGRTHKIQLILKVQQGGYTQQFLQKYSNGDNLVRLLCGTPENLVDIIREVDNNVNMHVWQHGLRVKDWHSHVITSWGVDALGTPLVDHFNEILYRIFVESGYEQLLDKQAFIRQCNIRVCPYCGMTVIPSVIRVGRAVKPPIDHFLPKRHYPFFGMSYYNLIPSCQRCNNLECKGEFNPLTDDLMQWKLYNPYQFEDNKLMFSFEYNGNGIYDEHNYKVFLTAANDLLDEGYCTQLALRSIYEGEQLKVKDMFVNFNMNKSKFFLIKLGIPKSFFNNLDSLVIGHPLDGRASERPYYKFSSDIFQYAKTRYKL